MHHPTDSIREQLRFPDGDHLDVTTPTRGHVHLAGHLAGDAINVTLPTQDALEQAYLLCQYAPDALVALEPTRSEQVGNAIIAAVTLADQLASPPPRFTQTLPRDDGPDWPATTARIFPSVPGHREGLDVLAYLEDDAPRFHIGPATLDADQARALIAHLTAILDEQATR